ncbi:MAG: hypothetical protein Q4A70_01310 [Candidatus Saccharibacteria bacterium]|nr:hypothetical protein [Candidatus Saccharibacteria bacterium]
MIENLRLENTAAHNSDGTLAQGYGTSTTYGNFSGLADPEAPDKFSLTYSPNSLYSSDGNNGTINIGTTIPHDRTPRYNNANTPSIASDRPQNPTTNWSAAIADLTPTHSFDQSITSTSLCPTGWHLPKGGTKGNEANNEFWSLIVTGIHNGTNPANYESNTRPYYGGTQEGRNASKTIRMYPNNFLYSGYVTNGSINNRGSNGIYWSSTSGESTISGTSTYGHAYGLNFASSNVYPGTYGYINKTIGSVIRCLISGT